MGSPASQGNTVTVTAFTITEEKRGAQVRTATRHATRMSASATTKEPAAAGQQRDQTIDDQGAAEASSDDQTTADEEEIPRWRMYLLTLALGLRSLLAAFDASMLGPALPAITSEFQALDHIGWYTSAYLLAQMPFQLVFSRLAVYYEAKMFNMVALVVFEVGSVLCATAPNSPVFILGRAVSGLGAAGMVAGAFVIIGNIPMRERPRLLAIFFALQSIALTAGPSLSGALTDSYLTWRFTFWIQLPIGFVALVTFQFVVRKRPSSKAHLPLLTKLKSCYPLDTALLIGCLVLLFLALQWGGSARSYSSPRVWGCLLGSGLLAVIFSTLQVRNKGNGLVPLRLITQRTIASCCLMSLLNGAANITHITMLPTYLQTVHGLSATMSGVYQLPITGSNIFAMAVASATISRTGRFLPFLHAGPVIYLAGAVLLQQLRPDSPLAWVLGSAVPVGAGFGFTVHACLLAVQNACSAARSKEDMPVAAVMEVFSQQLGRAIAISIAQSVFVQKLYAGLAGLVTASGSPAADSQGLLDMAGQGLEQMVHTMQTLDPGTRDAVRGVLSAAVTTAFILPVAAMATAALASLVAERRSIDMSKKKSAPTSPESGDTEPGSDREKTASSTVKDAALGDAEKNAQ
ncbi:major facilitator superfamily domain-containing protein [Microdochium bolleyi]|uniref:Major facilitator superfamily domain-containing protein n=1 Tax=Microdochium bolleyi TaxID=196109 RepID=A0A136IZF8_9PEZI|nr:major facilitator superfamily domain-containing protein [Microdochium bolleyi]